MTLKRILYVCMGNICRSPAAEAITEKFIAAKGLSDEVLCDSAGTISYHEGSLADPRMRALASTRGYEIRSISRPLVTEDFERFDYIVAMDEENYREIKTRQGSQPSTAKIVRICDFAKSHSDKEVPDPYYGGEKGFEKVIDLLEDACENFVDKIADEITQTTTAR